MGMTLGDLLREKLESSPATPVVKRVRRAGFSSNFEAEGKIVSKKEKDFGEFLTKMAASADPMTKSSITEISKEIEAARQEQLKHALRRIFEDIHLNVERLRQHRLGEARLIDEIKRLEGKANEIVKGKL